MFKRIVIVPVVVTLLLSSSNALAIPDSPNFMLFPNNIVGLIGDIGLPHSGILSSIQIDNTPDGASSNIAIRIQRSITGQYSSPWGIGGIIGHYPIGLDIGYPNMIIDGNLIGNPLHGNLHLVNIQASLLMHRLGVGF